MPKPSSKSDLLGTSVWVRPTFPFIADPGEDSNDPNLLRGSDRRAIAAWLHSVEGKESTRKQYLQQVERLWIWMRERDHSLKTLKAADLEEFLSTLVSPPASWIPPLRDEKNDGSTVSTSRRSGRWYPMQRPYAAASLNFAATVVRLLFTWLHDRGYVLRNESRLINGGIRPASFAVVPMEVPTTEDIETAIDLLVHYASTYIGPEPFTKELKRAAFIWGWTYYAGASRRELAGTRLNDLCLDDRQTVVTWFTKDQERSCASVPLPTRCVDLLCWYFEWPKCELPQKLAERADAYLVRPIRGHHAKNLEALVRLSFETANRMLMTLSLGRNNEQMLRALGKARSKQLSRFRIHHLLVAGVPEGITREIMRTKRLPKVDVPRQSGEIALASLGLVRN